MYSVLSSCHLDTLQSLVFDQKHQYTDVAISAPDELARAVALILVNETYNEEWKLMILTRPCCYK